MRRIMKICWSIATFLTFLSMISFHMMGSSLGMAFARGNSLKLDLVLQNQSEFQAKLGKNIASIVIFLTQILAIIEFYCYVQIYRDLKQNDIKIAKSVCPKVIKSRRKRNVTNLFGQTVSSAIGFALAGLSNALLSIFPSHSHVFPISMALLWTLISLTQFFTSGELRRHYFTV